MGDLTRNFSRIEFACKSPDGNYCNCHGAENFPLSIILIERLQKIRDDFGGPIRINSGYRCAEQNKRVGGVSTSAHLTGRAADFRCDNSEDRHTLVELVHRRFNRVGIASLFLHVDVAGEDKAQGVTWLYPPKEST